MAVAHNPARSSILTYDAYLNEGELTYRYDIIDGVRTVPPAPLTLHQVIQMNLAYVLEQYRRSGGPARPLTAPVDVLIRRSPLRVRQPDLLLISVSAFRQHNVRAIRGPLEFAPELVVEIASDSDRKQVLDGKIADYAAIGVRECWVVRPDDDAVEVLGLTEGALIPVGRYGQGETVPSITFTDLRVAVSDIFAE